MMALASPLRRPLVITPGGYYGAPRPRRKGVHFGLDFEADEGDPVIAAAPGMVVRVGWDPPPPQGGGGGNFVIVHHVDDNGLEYETGYMHLQAIGAAVDYPIAAGELLGEAGRTGAIASGPHLHFQVKQLLDGAKKAIDPTGLLPLQSTAPAASSASGVGRVLAWLGGAYLLGRWLWS